MLNPTVSFVVPCYKLAHLLPECVRSILSQTYGDLEVLIMDDCSPDDTPDVARSFGDPRVQHIRNVPNLGHLRNYNKGIGLARGKYVWLISADDYLRRPYVLRRYVELLEKYPKVGYTFCAGVGVRDGRETEKLAYSVRGEDDRILPGAVWLKTLLRENAVLAASGLVRSECYERLGTFPLDMPWAGDWYLWCLFALYYDVAYFAEPMVCYREHAQSMTSHLTRHKLRACCLEEVSISWNIKRRADSARLRGVSRACLEAVSQTYAYNLTTARFGSTEPGLTQGDFEESVDASASGRQEREWVQTRVYSAMANRYYWQGDVARAKHFYEAALRVNPYLGKIIVKRALLSFGRVGGALRKGIHVLRSGTRARLEP